MRGVQETNKGKGMLELFDDGPCCESPDCTVGELFQRPDESREVMVARLTALCRRLIPQEVQP